MAGGWQRGEPEEPGRGGSGVGGSGAVEPPRRDVSGNVAGIGVAHEAVRRRQREGAGAARSWEAGVKGEREVGQVLARLTTVSAWDRVRGRRSRWRVLHSVQITDSAGAPRGDIDHVVIGPPGVVTINTKYHRRGRVEVDGERVFVNGRSTAYVPKSRREAEQARGMLAAALAEAGHPELAERMAVRAMVVVVGAVPRVTRESAEVPVVALQRLRPTLLTMSERLTPDEVAVAYELACRDTTWSTPRP